MLSDTTEKKDRTIPSRLLDCFRASRSIYVVLIWVLVGFLMLPFDLALVRWNAEHPLPGDIRALFARAEIFGHGYGLAGIAITIYLLDPARRGYLPQLVISFISGGMVANLIKVQFWRTRPYHYDLASNASTFVGSIWTSWDWSAQILRSHDIQSFPSAHTAGAVAAAYVLSRLYPAGTVWFYLLTVLCAMNRIDGNAHFLSDVCWGAALGYAMATLIARYTHVYSHFDVRFLRRPAAFVSGIAQRSL